MVFTSDGVLAQFDGYDQLEEFDFAGYRARYGNFRRLDRLLEAEGDSPNRYQVCKQADVLMLRYLLHSEELQDLLSGLGYHVTEEAGTDRRLLPRADRRRLHAQRRGHLLGASPAKPRRGVALPAGRAEQRRRRY